MKEGKYGKQLEASDSAFGKIDLIPFSLESYGAADATAMKFLSDIVNNHWNPSARLSMWRYSLVALSVGLQRGNALIARRGIASLRRSVVYNSLYHNIN
jgi:hypothetical protein